MSTLTMDADYNVVFQADDSDIIMFSGSGNGMAFQRCEGDSVMATGQDQSINTAKLGPDNNIYDMGKGLQINDLAQLFNNSIDAADLQVWGFQNDRTGAVNFQTEQLGYTQTESITSDMQGGSFLNVGGPEPFQVHFMHDPVANLAAHLKVT